MTSTDFRDQITTNVACGNCDWNGPASEAQPIDNLALRITPGETVPAGECPACHALCYLDKDGPDAETDPEATILAAAVPMLHALEGVAYRLKGELAHCADETWAKNVERAIRQATGKEKIPAPARVNAE